VSVTSPTYGGKHQARRKQDAPLVDSGQAYCAEIICLYEQETGNPESRLIEPGSPWDEAHDRQRPGHYLGPAHARCNRAEGGRVQTQPKPPEYWPL
jgi:hypothetical protein